MISENSLGFSPPLSLCLTEIVLPTPLSPRADGMYGRPLCKMHCKITPQRPRQGLLQYLSGSMCSPAAAETKWCSVEFWPGCVNLALDSVRELGELEHKCTKCNGAVWKDSLSDETYQDQGCWCSLDVNGKLFCDYRACRIK